MERQMQVEPANKKDIKSKKASEVPTTEGFTAEAEVNDSLKADDKLIQLEKNSTPLIPDTWNYKEALESIKSRLLSWRSATQPMMDELWRVRTILKDKKLKRKFGIQESVNWTQFCEHIGTTRQVINQWLRNWFTPNKSTTDRDTFEQEPQEITCKHTNKKIYIYTTKLTYANGKTAYTHYVAHERKFPIDARNIEPLIPNKDGDN